MLPCHHCTYTMTYVWFQLWLTTSLERKEERNKGKEQTKRTEERNGGREQRKGAERKEQRKETEPKNKEKEETEKSAKERHCSSALFLALFFCLFPCSVSLLCFSILLFCYPALPCFFALLLCFSLLLCAMLLSSLLLFACIPKKRRLKNWVRTHWGWTRGPNKLLSCTIRQLAGRRRHHRQSHASYNTHGPSPNQSHIICDSVYRIRWWTFFQPCIFRCELLVSGRYTTHNPCFISPWNSPSLPHLSQCFGHRPSRKIHQRQAQATQSLAGTRSDCARFVEGKTPQKRPRKHPWRLTRFT